MRLPPGLDDLLRALRAAGLPVGAREVLRLHRTFELEPALAQERAPGDQLRDLLGCALVHSPEEREIFDQVYGPWTERWQSWDHLRRAEEPERLPRAEARPAEAWWRRRVWRRLLIGGRLLAPAIVAGILLPYSPPERVLSPPVQAISPAESDQVGRPAGESSAVTPESPPVPIHYFVNRALYWTILYLILGSLSLLAAGFRGWRFRRRRWIPEPIQDPTLPGPTRLPLLPLAETGPELLDGDGARTIIWGVGRHLTEDLTTEIDLAETVDRTAAAGGIPELCFERDRRLREVWLWVDGTGEDPALESYCEEIATSLEEAGLPVRVGGFDGYPLELRWDEGQRFRPQELEGHRQTALVAVCTDGEVLRRHLGDTRQELVRGLLRALAAWPRLAFVDFSRGSSGVDSELRRYGIPCIAPEAVPAFFGLGSATVPALPAEDPGDLRAWAAALVVSPRPVDRRSAHALRRELGLRPSPWALPQLSEQGVAALGGRLAWSTDVRRELLSWLGSSEGMEAPEIRAGGLLDHALSFWERRFDDEERERRDRGEIEAWEERPARRYLQMERGLLQLWREPGKAAEALFEVRADEMGDVIRTHLEQLAPWDCWRSGSERIRLPWRLADQTDRVRYLLAELGLGGVGKGRLRSPGRLGLGLGLLAGIGILMIGLAVLGQAPPMLVEVDQDSVDDEVSMRFAELPGGTFQIGSDDSDRYAQPDEKPAHKVTITGFWIGVTEVTNAQYRWYRPDHPGDDDMPAVEVSWHEARGFCQSLRDSEGSIYDLPTETEWEYAARAGTDTRWSFGDDENELATYAWYGEGPEGRAHEVATRLPNPWDLYDMHGNVWEWVRDCYTEDAYGKRAEQGTVADPGLDDEDYNCQFDEANGAWRVLRGGSYWNEPWWLRSAGRVRREPEDRVRRIGFRCVRRPRRQLDPSTP